MLCEPAFADLESLASDTHGAIDDEAEEVCLRALGILSACASGLISPDLDLTILDGDSSEIPSEDSAVVTVRERMLSSVQNTIEKYGSRVQVAIVGALWTQQAYRLTFGVQGAIRLVQSVSKNLAVVTFSSRSITAVSPLCRGTSAGVFISMAGGSIKFASEHQDRQLGELAKWLVPQGYCHLCSPRYFETTVH